MSPDENDLRHSPATGWTPVIAVILVTVLTATSVGVLVASRHGRPGQAASGPRVTSPTPPPTSQANNVRLSAPSSTVVWALVDSDALFRSTDRGEHWEKRSLPSDFGVRPSISFLNDHEGWLLAPGSPATQCQEASASVWHTTDAGASWQQLPVAGFGAAQCKEVIYLSPDARHCFVTAWDDNHQPTVYWSVDGGIGWKRATLPDPPDFKTLPGGFTLRVQWVKQAGGTLYLEAYGEQGAGTPYPDVPNRQYIFTSTDFGGTWVWKQKVGSRALAIVTPSRWLELDAPGQLAETVDGGHSVSPFDSDLDPSTPAAGTVIVFGDADVGYVAAGGSIQRTVNGGRHWAPVATPWAAQFTPAPVPSPSPIAMPTTTALSAPSANVVWALVGGARLFVSMDRGQTWEERAMPRAPAGSQATEISFVDDTNGWLSTCANTTTLLWKTTDGAQSWHTVSSPFPPDQCLFGLAFVDRTHGFISARYDYSPPGIFRTTDGGDDWSGSSIQNPPGFQAGQPGYGYDVLHVVTFGTVYYLVAHGSAPGGDTGYVFDSTDQGGTWKYLVTTPIPPASLVLVTATRWLAIGNDGSGQESTDAGKDWHALATDYQDAAGVPSNFVFATPSIGYGTVRGGIQRTVDGGTHWTLITTPGTQQPR